MIFECVWDMAWLKDVKIYLFHEFATTRFQVEPVEPERAPMIVRAKKTTGDENQSGRTSSEMASQTSGHG